MQKLLALTTALILGVCATGQAQRCTLAAPARTLPREVRETSGLARGRARADVFWTHNDSGNPQLYAVSADGAIKGRVSLNNVKVTDWEDIASGPCGDANCLYLADIGDNAGRRSHVSVYEVIEPAPGAAEAAVGRIVQARYADGPQDAEALFRLPSGEIYVVTKGRHKPIRLYQLNMAGTGGVSTLQLIRELAPQPHAEADRVTSATASPNGQWVAVRSYATLYIYRTRDLLNGGAPVVTHSLVPLGEDQGEAVTLDNDGMLWLTSEAGRKSDLPTITALRCALP
jgi:hypothetical protein